MKIRLAMLCPHGSVQMNYDDLMNKRHPRDPFPTTFPFKFPEFLGPILGFLADDKCHNVKEIREEIQAEFELTPWELDLTHKGDAQTFFVNKVAHAFARLVSWNAIVNCCSEQECYRITDHGR